MICFQVEKNKKYAKWKAAYIHKCLKTGETPVPGPIGGDEEDGEFLQQSLFCTSWFLYVCVTTIDVSPFMLFMF